MVSGIYAQLINTDRNKYLKHFFKEGKKENNILAEFVGNSNYLFLKCFVNSRQ